MTRAFGPLVNATQQGASVLAVVHTVKGFDSLPDDEVDIQHIRGSGAMVANSTVVALYKKPEETRLRDNTRFFKIGRCKFGMPARTTFYTQLTDDARLEVRENLDVAFEQNQIARQQVIDAVKALQAEGARPTKKAVRERSGLSQNVNNALLDDLYDDGLLTRTGRGVAKDPQIYGVV